MIRSTPDHLSRRTDWHRCQWQGRGGLPRAGVQGADAFASPGAEVDWSCEDQADWSKRVDVAVGGGGGGGHNVRKKPSKKAGRKPKGKRPFVCPISCIENRLIVGTTYGILSLPN